MGIFLLGMKRNILILQLLLGFCTGIAAQNEATSGCPSISVTGPAGIVKNGEIMTFTADVKGNAPDIKYVWSLSEGTIESGQGTPTINVRKLVDFASVTATLEIKGLRTECANRASETYVEEYAPRAEKLDQFLFSFSSTIDDRLRKI